MQHVVKSLSVPAFALTDYNPHGMALMLCYKHGSVRCAARLLGATQRPRSLAAEHRGVPRPLDASTGNGAQVALGIEQYCCPQLQWLGLHAADVTSPTALSGAQVASHTARPGTLLCVIESLEHHCRSYPSASTSAPTPLTS